MVSFSVEFPTESKFAQHVFETKASELHVLVAKNQDYGPKAISGVPYGPLVGVNVRLWDKLMRAVHLGENEGGFESVVDTYQDIANYGTIAQMILNGVWNPE